MDCNDQRMKYLKLLSHRYPSIDSAATEIINLKAILNLPKGTEHFVSDIHGEFDSFNHVLRNASGVIKNYIKELFDTALRENEQRDLATLIYYPEQKIQIAKKSEEFLEDWYRINLFRLVRICKRVSSKYTRSRVRRSLPEKFGYIMEELIHEDSDRPHKHEYYNEIIDTIISLDRADKFIIEISSLIQCLAIDRLHIIGDIYDRGHAAEKIMDILNAYHSLDIQWGNHDICWMGAALGSDACICNVIRVSCRYNNLHTIEEGYGINLVPLAIFAMEKYADDPCTQFFAECEGFTQRESEINAKMHKAICIIQLKVEGQLIKRHEKEGMNFGMSDRMLLHRIDFEKKTVLLDKEYPLMDSRFPTIDPADPYALTEEELDVLNKIRTSFFNSEKLGSHVRLLFGKGSMYKIFNSNLLYHGCIPLNRDGSLKKIDLGCGEYSGRALMDKMEEIVRVGYMASKNSPAAQEGLDLMWYLWCGEDSPLYGKDKMTTFERCFIDAPELFEEKNDPYYSYRDSEETCKMILADFGLTAENSHIINGHVPVRVSRGESPVKAGGRLLVIDGGFTKAYQQVTGIAGYTLIYNSKGLLLASHEPFVSRETAILQQTDITTTATPLEPSNGTVISVRETDTGREIMERVHNLEELLQAYYEGRIKAV